MKGKIFLPHLTVVLTLLLGVLPVTVSAICLQDDWGNQYVCDIDFIKYLISFIIFQFRPSAPLEY
jgi:hypothetical protein